MMMHILTRYWWVLVMRGTVSLLFAAIAFALPVKTFEFIVLLLGAFLLVDGLLAVFSGIRLRREDDEWWVGALEGAVGVGLGIATLVKPEITAALLVLFVALWCLVTGALEIGMAIKIRKEIENEWQLALAGVISIAWWVGFYALFFGLLMVGLGLRLRRWGRKL